MAEREVYSRQVQAWCFVMILPGRQHRVLSQATAGGNSRTASQAAPSDLVRARAAGTKRHVAPEEGKKWGKNKANGAEDQLKRVLMESRWRFSRSSVVASRPITITYTYY